MESARLGYRVTIPSRTTKGKGAASDAPHHASLKADRQVIVTSRYSTSLRREWTPACKS